MYELAPVGEIISFIDETSGGVTIDGVEINEDMLAVARTPRTPRPQSISEPQPEPEPEWLPNEIVDSEVEVVSQKPHDAEAEAMRLARARRLEEQRMRREAARIAREAKDAERRRATTGVAAPLTGLPRDRKAKYEAVRLRQQQLRAEAEERCRALEQIDSERPAWWAQTDRLMSHLTQLDISKLDSNLLGKFASWTDAKKLVHALIREICQATADIDRNPSTGRNPHETIAVAVAKQLLNNGEMAGLLRLLIADADESGMVLLPTDKPPANHAVGARLLTWLQRILATYLDGSTYTLPSSLIQSALTESPHAPATSSRGIATPRTVKRRQVNARKELLWREAQDFRIKRPKLQTRLNRVQSTSGRTRERYSTLKLPAVGAHQTEKASCEQDGSKPILRYSQLRAPTNAVRIPLPPAAPRPPNVSQDVVRNEAETTDLLLMNSQRSAPREVLRNRKETADLLLVNTQSAASVPHPPPGSKLPPLHTAGARRLQEQRVSFSRKQPTVRCVAGSNSGPRRGGTSARGWGAPGMVMPATGVYSSGRRFLPPDSVDWSKSISARF